MWIAAASVIAGFAAFCAAWFFVLIEVMPKNDADANRVMATSGSTAGFLRSTLTIGFAKRSWKRLNLYVWKKFFGGKPLTQGVKCPDLLLAKLDGSTSSLEEYTSKLPKTKPLVLFFGSIT
jgi:hypothetical protein